MRINIADTSIGKQSNIKDYGKNSVRFLVDNVDSIAIEKAKALKLLKGKNSLLNTIIGELYQRALMEEKLELFTLLNLSNKKNLPSTFLISWLDIDVLSLKNTDENTYKILSSLPEYCDQILVDITPYLSVKTGEINDITGVQSRVIRDLLCRNYELFDTLWLTPNILYYITKIYCLILANKIGKVYNLNYQETFKVATVIAVFFTLRCSTSKDVINPIMHKMDFLTRMVDTKPIFKYISEKYTDKEFTLQAMVDTIVEFTPDRMSKLSVATYLSVNTSLGSSQITSLVNLEYPPYFTAAVLGALSGDKSSIYFQLKNLKLKRDADTLAKELLKSNSFIHDTY